ncbi:MAG: glycosyltransferase [Isosphaeraceae bacterium]|nr:glycosyltransferase [Isosphaeraceae bacterium]
MCHLGKYYPPAPGGIETNVRILAQAQAELGLEVKVFCVHHRSSRTVVEADGPVEVTRFGRWARVDKLDLCPGLSAAVAACDADLFHLHVPNPTMILALLAARPGKPVVVTYQADPLNHPIRARLFRPFERRAYRMVPTVFQTSPYYAAGSRFLRRYTDRLDLLPNGIVLDPYLHPSAEHRATAERLRARFGRPLWLCAGRLVYYKGLPNAIRALEHVAGTLLIVGGGPKLPALRAEAQRRGVADRVVFVGNLPHYLDIVPYYLAADAFWFPSNSRSEGFGIVQVEAMASGCPVINTAIPHSGVAWVSRHEREGLTVPMDDPEALAAAAHRLLHEPGLRTRLAEAARARVIAEFDHRTMAQRSLAAYHRILGLASQPRPASNPLILT